MRPLSLPPFERNLARASPLPARLDTQPDVLAAERELVFARTWQPVGRAEQVDRPGDFFTAEVANEPGGVVRDNGSILRAFFNVCRHRAGPGAEDREDRMTLIYHLVTPDDWERSPAVDYRAPSLAAEGFIHCSHAEQVAGSANRHYAEASNLLLLHIDPDHLLSPLLDEASSSGELFPHIHGPLNRAAVVRVQPLVRGADGRWEFVP